jgi:hypothetical protein
MCSPLLAGAAALVLAFGTAPATPTPSATPPSERAAGPGVVEFPGIRVFTAERRLEVDAAFAIVAEEYYLEYLAVAPQGKLHESLLEVKCAPEKLQLGLILLGLEPRAQVQYHGEAVELTAPRVAIDVEWSAKDTKKRVRVEDLLFEARLGGSMPHTGFAFTGSRFIQGFARGNGPAPSQIFAATSSGSAISLYHDPDAILDNPLLTGGDVPLLSPTFDMVEVVGWVPGDERYRPYAERLPAQGTPCVLHMRPLK